MYSVSLSFAMCLYHLQCVSVCLSCVVCQRVTIIHSVSLSITVCHHHARCVTIMHSVSPSFAVCQCVSISCSVCLYQSQCVSIMYSVSLPFASCLGYLQRVCIICSVVRRVREYIYMARVCVLWRTHLRCAAHSVCRV